MPENNSFDEFDFVVFYDLLFPDDEKATYECPFCARLIKGSEEVAWLDKKRRVFKCPDCDNAISLD